MSSEIARLMAQIDQEYEAMKQAMYGFATVGRHQIIAHRYDSLDKYQQELEKFLGKEEAFLVINETYTRAMEAFDEQGGTTK